MARKPAVSIQETKETNEDYEQYLDAHKHQLICMEVYSDFCGPCLATGNAIRKGKLELGQDNIAMVRCVADNIDALERFRNRSEPVFLFIVRHKLVRAMFGPNGIELCRIIEEELKKKADEDAGVDLGRPTWEIHEMLPVEAARQKQLLKIEEEYKEQTERLRVLTLAARKKRVNERLSWTVRRLNFIMFWPHCHQAHYDLYEKWDMINISVAAKETFQLDEDAAREILYMSDVDPNEACLHALFSGEVLVVLFKMLDSDHRNFVQLMRYALYEEIPIPKEDVPPEQQLPPIPAYERYASISKSAREIRRDRYNAKQEKLITLTIEKLASIPHLHSAPAAAPRAAGNNSLNTAAAGSRERLEKEDADRLLAEQARIAREAEEEAARIEKQKAEEARMARIAAGLPADPEPVVEELVEGEEGEGGGAKSEFSEPATTGTDVTGAESEAPVEEVLVVKDEVFDSDVEIEGEDFIPAGGLFVPGLYSPPSDLSKSNGLAYLFPKVIKALTEEELETEFLPPHILVMFPVDKRYDVQEVVNTYASEILNIGFFEGDDPYTAEHVAYTIKQYDKIFRPKKHLDRLAVMVSRKRSLPLLQLAGFNPVFISSDVNAGEKECLALFPVGYGDDYAEEESIKEEEVVVVEHPVETVPEAVEETEEGEPKAPDEDEEEEG